LERPDNHCHKIYNNTHGIKTALKVLKSGGTLCMMPDLISVTASAIYVPFFARFFTAMSGIAFLALRSNAAVIPVYCHAGENGCHVLEFRPPLVLTARTESSDEDRAYDFTCLLFRELERQIALRPEQWRYWHVYIKRSIAFPVPPASASDLCAQLKKATAIVSPDKHLSDVVQHWIDLLDQSNNAQDSESA
jgi:lauroyl/myristoyl acyltransferase